MKGSCRGVYHCSPESLPLNVLVSNFLGYRLHGKPTKKGTSIKPILSIPREKVQRIKESLRMVGEYHQIPEVDAIVQMSAMFRGWCNYYRYANGPQATFEDLSRYT
jgi:hypothetical protein